MSIYLKFCYSHLPWIIELDYGQKVFIILLTNKYVAGKKKKRRKQFQVNEKKKKMSKTIENIYYSGF